MATDQRRAASPSVSQQNVEPQPASPQGEPRDPHPGATKAAHRRWIESAFPFSTSILAHLAIIGLGIATYQVTQIPRAASASQPFVPDSSYVDKDANFPHLDADQERRQDLLVDPRALIDAIPTDGTEIPQRLGSEMATLLNATPSTGGDSAIGFAQHVSSIPGVGNSKTEATTGSRYGILNGSIDGTKFFAKPTIPGGPEGPKLARSVIYVCDASGSMIPKFQTLREQLLRTVSQLKPIQTYNILFFNDGGVNALGEKQAQGGRPETLRKAVDFVGSVVPRGTTDPIPALKKAFAQHPDLIYLLTDGDFEDNQKVVDEIRALNRDHAVKINTIALFDRGAEYEKVLKDIATENGGVYRFVSPDDVGN